MKTLRDEVLALLPEIKARREALLELSHPPKQDANPRPAKESPPKQRKK